jgi:hypothetical protein
VIEDRYHFPVLIALKHYSASGLALYEKNVARLGAQSDCRSSRAASHEMIAICAGIGAERSSAPSVGSYDADHHLGSTVEMHVLLGSGQGSGGAAGGIGGQQDTAHPGDMG